MCSCSQYILIVRLAEESSEDDEDEEGDDGTEPENADEANKTETEVAENSDVQTEAQIAADEELAKSLVEEDIANEALSVAGPSVSTSSAEPTAGSSTGITAPNEEEEEAEPSSFECAWELLCLARDVFKRQIEYKGNESRVKLAEALQSLGEISIEWENNEAALDLLQESLSLRKESLSSDDRLIAET